MTPETTVYQIEQVNRIAQKERHLKVFTKGLIVKRFFNDVWATITAPFQAMATATAGINILPVAPHKRLFWQSFIFAVFMFAISSISPVSGFSNVSRSFSLSYIGTYSLPGDVLIADNDGYLIKINPQTGSSSRIGMTDYAVHTVEKGDTLSTIATRYGLKTETIMWENNIGNANSITIGQKLLIPPVDGVSYTAGKGDSLEKIAKKYNIQADSIVAQNSLISTTIVEGQSLFLPNARPIGPAKSTVIAKNTTKAGQTSNVRLPDNSSVPAGGKPFIYPTMGTITNGFKRGHYAIDIADRSKPAVWAAGAGTVIKASSGTWGGGYGNHVIIDHGDGLQSLYAHLDHLNVSEGEYVSQGQTIGQMGNTGRVYGATGIHLHWEVIKNGVKQYPGNYY